MIDIKTGLIENKFNFSSLVRPIINNQYAFFITKNDLLIAVDLKNKKIIYSYNINNKIIHQSSFNNKDNNELLKKTMLSLVKVLNYIKKK